MILTIRSYEVYRSSSSTELALNTELESDTSLSLNMEAAVDGLDSASDSEPLAVV